MRRSPTPLQQPGRTKKKGAHANRGYVFCVLALAASEVDGRDIGEGFDTPGPPGRQIRSSGGTVFEGAGGHDAETSVARNRQHGLGDNVGSRLRKPAANRDRRRRSEPAQDFKRASEVELCDSREDNEADVEIGQATFSSQMPLTPTWLVEIIAPNEDVHNGQVEKGGSAQLSFLGSKLLQIRTGENRSLSIGGRPLISRRENEQGARGFRR